MALFSKKKKENRKFEDIPKLPELPNLPDMMDEDYPKKEIPQLPKFPSNSFEQKFSQNTIKEAVTGKKEEKAFANEFASEDVLQMMREPQIRAVIPPRERLSMEIPSRYEPKKLQETAEPVFIRIDKFEEGMHALESAKKQILEIEKTLKDIRKTREEEEKELTSWEEDIHTAKEQIEKIDREIFSKLE